MKSSFIVGIGAGLIFLATGDYLSWMQQLLLVLGVAMVHHGVGCQSGSNSACTQATAQQVTAAHPLDVESRD